MTHKHHMLANGHSLEREDRAANPDKIMIAQLARAAKGGVVSVHTAAGALGLSSRAASIRLSALTTRGWLARIRRGLYLVLPLEAEPGRATVSEDPWILAREAFSPCYIGGWSAAEHWGLTEQLFRSTLVVTGASVRAQTVTLFGQEFTLFRVPPSRIGGTALVWRGKERVPVSTPERTLVDCLRHPELCGGVRHLAQMFEEYRDSEKANVVALLEAARENAGGALWKRLGYLTEALWPSQEAVIIEAQEHLTTGYIKLDPAVDRPGNLLRRWRLRVNTDITNL